MKLSIAVLVSIIWYCSSPVFAEEIDFKFKLSYPNVKVGIACVKSLSIAYDDMSSSEKKYGFKIPEIASIGLCYQEEDLTVIHFTQDSMGLRDHGIYYYFSKSGELIYRTDGHDSKGFRKIYNKRLYEKYIN